MLYFLPYGADASVDVLALEFAGTKCRLAGFVGGALVFGGLAGAASCKLIVQPGYFLLGSGEVGGGCREPFAQRRGALE